jgi:outer membrane protease
VLLILLTIGLSAQENPAGGPGLHFFAGSSLGMLQGRAGEIVYRDKDNKLSELLWNFTPLVYIGGDAQLGWRSPRNGWGLFAGTSFKFGLPGETGVMEDRDWTHSRYPAFLTHYSVHDNTTETAVLFDMRIGASFRFLNTFMVKTYIAYNYMFFSWTAKGGSFLYPESSGDNGGHGYWTTPVEVGTYEQSWSVITPGVSFYGAFNRYFNIELSLKASPFIWCGAEDNHILRNLIITSDMSGGLFFEPGLLFSFVPKDSFTLSLSVVYRSISGTRGNGVYSGDEVYKEYGTYSMTLENGLGAGYGAFDIGIGAAFRVF